MNKLKMTSWLALTAGASIFLPVMAGAEDMFQLSWTGHSYARGAGGDVVRSDFSEQDIINQVAANNGLSPSGLVFVYRVASHDTVVARASNGAFIADVIQFGLPNIANSLNDVTSVNGTHTVRQAFLFDEDHSTAIGSAAGTERLTRGTNGALTSFSFTGSFQYSKPDIGTVFTGTFVTIRRIP